MSAYERFWEVLGALCEWFVPEGEMPGYHRAPRYGMRLAVAVTMAAVLLLLLLAIALTP